MGYYKPIMGGADVIRQALRAGHVDEPAITIAPVATHISYRVVR